MDTQNELLPIGVGERLKITRKSKGLKKRDLSRKLHIRESVIALIESGKLEEIAPIYRKGYVLRYVKELDLPVDEFADILNNYSNNPPDLQTVFPEAPKQNVADRWLKATTYVLGTAIVGTLVWAFTHEATRLWQGEPAPNQDQASVSSLDTRPQNDNTHVSASIASLELIRKSKPQESPAEEAWAALSHSEPQEEVAVEESTSLLPGQQLLSLSASADSWVEITDATGAQLEMDLIRGGSNKQYNGQPPFRVRLGRASAVELIFADQVVDLGPYTRGNLASFTIDSETIAEENNAGEDNLEQDDQE